MNLIKLIKYIFLLLVISACDTRIKDFETNNTAPVLLFANGKDTYIDTCKIGMYGYDYLPVCLSIKEDNKPIAELSYAHDVLIDLYFKDVKLLNDKIPHGDTGTIVKFVPKLEGTSHTVFTATDKFGLSSKAQLTVFTFTNMLPEAKLNVTKVENFDPLEYQFDASQSFDKDRKWGGNIIKYVYSINGFEIVTIKPVINYIFPNPGTYTIKLHVIDNNNMSSSSINVTVNAK